MQNPPPHNGQRNRVAQQPDPDAMMLFDAYHPSLAAGTYRLVAQHSIALERGETHHYYRDQRWQVKTPRFRIEQAWIHACFPPRNGVGNYGQCLPHLCMTQRQLPWERRVWQEDSTPWLALLVLEQTEWERAAAREGSFAELFSQAKGESAQSGAVLLPELEEEGDTPDTRVQVIDLPLSVFQAICPTRDELKLLAHFRSINTQAKVPLAMTADGEFSILTSNRLPALGQNVALVVSLEGWGSLLDGTRLVPAGARAVRLLVLTNWRFRHDPQGHHHFGHLMQQLDIDTLRCKETCDEPQAAAALARGFIPLTHATRLQEDELAWYRGPLTPEQIPTNENSRTGAFPMAGGSAIHYAAAWQLGRMLALASPSFTPNLRRFVEGCKDSMAAATRLEAFVHLHRQALGEKDEDRSGDQDMFEPGREILDWLARLMLLYPVPFAYLVSHPALLPEESLRFFFLDNTWLTTMAEGALSTGLHALNERTISEQVQFSQTLSKIVFQHRRRILGLPLLDDPPKDFLTKTTSGLLLRSRIVAAWPGMEVVLKCPNGIPLDIVRMDHLSEELLLVWASGTIGCATFNEPREGLRFGLSSAGQIQARNLDTYQPEPNLTLQIQPGFLRKPAKNRTLDLTALAAHLSEKLIPGAGNEIGSAALALQFMQTPESQTIIWNSNP